MEVQDFNETKADCFAERSVLPEEKYVKRDSIPDAQANHSPEGNTAVQESGPVIQGSSDALEQIGNEVEDRPENDQIEQKNGRGISFGIGLQEAAKQAIVGWLQIIIKIMPTLTAVILFSWIFYLPAIILAPSLLDRIEIMLYYKGRDFIRSSTFWISIILIATEIFSYQFTKKPIFFVLSWSYLYDVFAMVLVAETYVSSIVNNVINIICLSAGLYVIYKSKKPEIMNKQQQVFYEMTKDGSVSAVLKGLFAYYFIMNFVFSNVYAQFLSSALSTKILYRFIVFPICFSLSKWIQIEVISHLSKENMERRLIQYKMSNHQIEFIGRIMLSNISTGSALSIEYVLVNLAASLMEVIATVSFEYRVYIFQILSEKLSYFFNPIKASLSRIRGRFEPVVPIHEAQDESAGQLEANVESRDDFMAEAILYRSKHLIDDIVSELYAIVLAPLLLYFVHPLIHSPTMQPIRSFKECFYQILIQLIFEFISDTSSILFELRRGRVEIDHFKTWEPVNQLLFFVWSIFYITLMHSSIVFYS